MGKVRIGQVVNVVGLRGELKVRHDCAFKERFSELSSITLGDRVYGIEKTRYHKNFVILKLEGIDDRAAAEAEKGEIVSIDEEILPPLPEGGYYVRDLIGLPVFDEKASWIGRLSDVFQNTAQDLYEVEMGSGKKILIPAVDEFILKIDIQQGFVEVKLMEGLLELAANPVERR